MTAARNTSLIYLVDENLPLVVLGLRRRSVGESEVGTGYDSPSEYNDCDCEPPAAVWRGSGPVGSVEAESVSREFGKKSGS